MEQGAWRVNVCGALAIEAGGEQIEGRLPGPQGRLLFAYLVLNRGRPVRRDELIDALWADEDARMTADIRPALSRLRKALGPERITGRGELQLVLPDGSWVDWEAVEEGLEAGRAASRRGDWRAASREAAEAVSIADRGLLPGMEAEWIDERRRRLAELRIEALEVLAGAGVALGGADLAAAERAARAAVDAAPFRESAHAALMQILRASGNVAEALRVYEDLRTTLRDELGTAPGPRLIALHEELLRADEQPAEAAPPVRVPSYMPQLDTLSRAGAGRDQIVERDAELSLLGSLVGEAAARSGSVALIEGPAGVGKSRLLAACRTMAADSGVTVLAGRASELEREFPFGLVRQLFETELADPARRERALAGAAAPAAAVFGALPGEEDGAGDASFASLHGLFWLAANLSSDAPLVLAIDDLHWVDAPSLRFFAYLAQRLEGLPILMAATLRSGEPAADATLLAELSAAPAVVSIRPHPLTEEAVGELVRARLGENADPAFSVACHRATVGNPLLLRQLLTALHSDGVEPTVANAEVVRRIGPAAVSRNVLHRLSRLGDEARATAQAVAVLGESAELPAVAALAGLEERRVADLTSTLARSEILRPDPPPGFVHPLVRDAVYHDLSLGERELEHERAARLLDEAGAPVEQVASHLLPIPRRADEWVSDRLIAAGSEAMRKGAPESGAAYLGRALAEPPPEERRPRVLFELGVAERLTNGPAGAEHLEAAYAALSDPYERANVAEILGTTLLFTGHPARSAEIAREAAAALPPEEQDVRRRLESVELSAPFFGAGARDELRRLERYRDAKPVDLGTKMVMAIAALNWVYEGGTAAQVTEVATHALEGGELIRAQNGLAAIPAIYALTMAERDEAVDWWREATAEAHRYGSLLSIASIHTWAGGTHYYRGELVEAEDSLQSSLDQFKRWGIGPPTDWHARAFLAGTLTARGDRDGAWRQINAVEDREDTSDAIGWWFFSKIDLLMAEGRWDAVIAVTDEVLARFPWASRSGVVVFEAMKSVALSMLGYRDEGLQLAHQSLERAERFGTPTSQGPMLRLLALLEPHRALEHLHHSLELLETSNNRLQYAKTLLSLGTVLRHTGSDDEARRHLRLALELGEASGARTLVDDARRELVEAGEEVTIEPPTGAAALTPTERRVAELAAAGSGQHEIAQALFLTPGDVATYLAGAYRKLGVGAREELAGALSAG